MNPRLTLRCGLRCAALLLWSSLIVAAPGARAAAPETAEEADCEPACRKGFVCVKGGCVSVCNPPCGAGETCTEERTCAPKGDSVAAAAGPEAEGKVAPAEDYPFRRARFGLGGAVGVAVSPDGTALPFGFQLAFAFPWGAATYGRIELAADYFKTKADDAYPIGGGRTAPTYTNSEHLLVAGRLTFGWALGRLVSLRVGPLVGYRYLYWENGMCGSSWQEREKTGPAFGGTGALAFTSRHAEFALVLDLYTAKNQGYCRRETTVVRGTTTYEGFMVATAKLDVKLFAQGTFFF